MLSSVGGFAISLMAIFTKGKNFYDLLLASMDKGTLPNMTSRENMLLEEGNP